jgi:tetratricopeptide (TPR) repeat protein
MFYNRPMPRGSQRVSLSFLFLAASAIILTACHDDFRTSLGKARQDFVENDSIGVIDTLNLALENWKESDGRDAKGQAYQLLGKSYQKLGNTDKAIEAFGRAVELSTNTYDAAYALGVYFLATQRIDNAIKSFRRALVMRANEPRSLLGLGDAFYLQQKYTDALATYRQIIRTSPAVSDALYNIEITQKKLRRQDTGGRVRRRR